jgi:hypothetical protein
MSDSACALVMTRCRRRERSSAVSSSTRAGVHDTVWLTESSWTPRKDSDWAGPSVLSGLTTRPNWRMADCASSRWRAMSSSVGAMRKKSSR